MAVIKMRMRASDVPEVLRNERDIKIGDDAAKGQCAVHCAAGRLAIAEGFVFFHSADLSHVILAMSRETVVYVEAEGEEAIGYLDEAVPYELPSDLPTEPEAPEPEMPAAEESGSPPAPPKRKPGRPRKYLPPDEG